MCGRKTARLRAAADPNHSADHPDPFPRLKVQRMICRILRRCADHAASDGLEVPEDGDGAILHNQPVNPLPRGFRNLIRGLNSY